MLSSRMIVWTLAALVLAASPARAEAAIRFAFVPGQNTLIHDDREAERLASYLQGHLHAPVQPVSYTDTAELVRTLEAGELDFAVLSNTAWRDTQKTLAVVANFTRSAAPTHEILLLTAKRRGFASVADLLATKPDLVLDQDVPSRHYFLIEQTGRATADAFRSTQTPRRTVLGVSGLLNDTYGAACVESSVLETVEKFDQGMARQLQILASAGPYASDPIVASQSGPGFLTEKLAATLLAMREDSLGQQVLLGLKVVGFVEPITDPALYPAVVEPKPVKPPPKPAAAQQPAPQPVAAKKVEAQAAAAEKKRREAYAKVVSLDTVEAYGAFLALYPDAPEAKQGLRRKTQLETEDKLYQAAKGSEDKLTAFLALFPDGRHAEDATARLAELRTARMEKDYWRATAEETPAALRAFLAEWPDSGRAREARAALAALVAAAKKAAAPAPKPAPKPRWVLRAPFVKNAPAVSGLGSEKVWGRAPSLAIPLAGAKGPETLKVAALHDGARLFLLARWADATGDADLDPWLWNETAAKYVREEQLSDGLSVFWYRDPAPPTSCMISGDEVDADAWMWRPQWSELSGLADDWTLRVSGNRLPKANPYTSRNGRGQVWIRRAPDSGEPGWRFVVPLENQGEQVSSYGVQQCTQSRCDVRAAARWEGKKWTLVLERDLDTGNADDTRLVPGTTRIASFAVYDRAGRADHNSSPLVEVELAPAR